MPQTAQPFPWLLGIDLGSNSIGWAALECPKGEPSSILDLGVRVFPAGADRLESGADESHAAKRREARLARRQTDRRRRRIQSVYRLLSSFGLLPPASTSEEVTRAISELDRSLARLYSAHDNLPYVLRARALDCRLDNYEIGRALFHLAQRRGFLSNRKSARKSDDSVVYAGITTLDRLIKESGARTLGEYLSRLNPHDARIRDRYTARRMYVEEFEQIWSKQSAEHPEVLTPGRKEALFHALFFQRPLRDQSKWIGPCELEPGEPRAPRWHPLVQRFRLLQEVNNLRLIDASGAGRPLEQNEREAVIGRLERGKLSFKSFRKLLGLDESVEVNLESGGKKELIGDETAQAMRAPFQSRWDDMSETERLEAISDLAGDLDDDSLAAKARERWGLDEVHVEKYVRAKIETGTYAAFSLKAICRLLPHLERGSSVTEARAAEYPETFHPELRDCLPPVLGSLQVRNPAVVRALTELRKVVNGLIRRYGKPQEVHIELARDLRAPKAEREKRWQRMRQNEKERARAAEDLLRQALVSQPSRTDIERWLLAQECDFTCPYTGRRFSGTQLYHTGEIQVEHIIPFPRSLDDSFANKTLAYASVNRIKGDRSPLEAFGGSAEWESILERVRRFQGPYAKHKLRRFQWNTKQIDELLKDFTTRQLTDTRYASKVAAQYLASLYGGRHDSIRQRIFVSPGEATAYLRRLWSIENLLSSDGRKSREDHRHHAIDAVVIALTGPKWVKALSDAAADARRHGRSRISSIEAPWPGFAADVRNAIDRIVVSHRVDRKVGGPMHDESFYGRIQGPDGEQITVRRKYVHELSKKELELIVDPVVRERVALQWNAHQQDFKKLEADPPTMPNRKGEWIPIRKVRIRFAETPRRIGEGVRARHVVGDQYHHFEVFEVTDWRSGKVRFEYAPVTVQQAMERVRAGVPVVCRDPGPGARFMCSVAKDDTLEIVENGRTRLVRVAVLEASGNRIGIQDICDARPFTETGRERRSVNDLFGRLRCRKVNVTPLGEIHPAHD